MSDVTSRAWWDWRKMPGARYIADRGPALDPVSGRVPEAPSRGWEPYPGAVPDETDPATLGCLTQRAREMWGDPNLYARPRMYGPGWIVLLDVEPLTFEGDTELAALVAACDAAPGGGA